MIQESEIDEAKWDDEFYVNINEAANLSKLTISQIRYLEKQLGVQIGSGDGRNRRFNKSDVRWLRLAEQLLRSGKRPAEIAEQLRNRDNFNTALLPALSKIIDAPERPFADGFILAKTMSSMLEIISASLKGSQVVKLILSPSNVANDEAKLTEWVGLFQEASRTGADVELRDCLIAARTKKALKVFYCSKPCLLETKGTTVHIVEYSNSNPEKRGAVVAISLPESNPRDTRGVNTEPQETFLGSELSKSNKDLLERLLGIVRSVESDFVGSHPNMMPYRSAYTNREAIESAIWELLGENGILYKYLSEEDCQAAVIQAQRSHPPETEVVGQPQPNELKMKVWTPGWPPSTRGNTLSLNGEGSKDKGISAWAFSRGAIAISNNPTTDSRFKYAHLEGSRAAVAIPLVLGCLQFGVFYIFSRKDKISRTLLQLLIVVSTIITEYYGRSILAEEREKTEEMVNSESFQRWLDNYTTIPEPYIPQLREAIERLPSGPNKLAILFFDIDKSTNLSERKNLFDRAYGGDLNIIQAMLDTKKFVEAAIKDYCAHMHGYLPPYHVALADRDHIIAIIEGIRSEEDLTSLKVLLDSMKRDRRRMAVPIGEKTVNVTMSIAVLLLDAFKLKPLGTERALSIVRKSIERMEDDIKDALEDPGSGDQVIFSEEEPILTTTANNL